MPSGGISLEPAKRFKDLLDVDVSGVLDGYVPYYDEASGLWKCKAVSGMEVHGNEYHNPDFEEKGVAAKTASGSYVGDDSEDRPIPHGLGCIPKYVYIVVYGGWARFFLIGDGNFITGETMGEGHIYPVTAWDEDNFHVGNSGDYEFSGNADEYDYQWIAFG
jgi:hypothetical protein